MQYLYRITLAQSIKFIDFTPRKSIDISSNRENFIVI